MNQNGHPVTGATISVLLNGTQSLAPIFSDEGSTPLPNPTTSNNLGRFEFYVADGDYDLVISGTGIITYTLSDVSIFQQTAPSGSSAVTVTTKATNYTATTADRVILVDATSGNITITLPAAAANSGRLYDIKKIDSTANPVTIDPNGAELINGFPTLILPFQWRSVEIVSNGTSWFSLSSFSPTIQSFWFTAAGRSGAAGASAWDLPATSAAVPGVDTSATTQLRGVLEFADTGGELSAQYNFRLPPTYRGSSVTAAANIVWYTPATTGSVEWKLYTICQPADGTALLDAAFDTITTTGQTAPGTANWKKTSNISVPLTNCDPGDMLTLKLSRNGANAGDTLGATAMFVGFELILPTT